jgi:hypothetical protein
MARAPFLLVSSPDERSEIRDITPQCRSSYAKRQAQTSGVTSRGHLSATTKGGQDPDVATLTDLRCKSGIVCAGLVMPTVNLTRILSEAGGISSVGRRSSVGIWISIVSRSVSSTIDPANVPTVGSIILCISM